MPLEHTVSIQASQAHKMQSASMYGIFFYTVSVFLFCGLFSGNSGHMYLVVQGANSCFLPPTEYCCWEPRAVPPGIIQTCWEVPWAVTDLRWARYSQAWDGGTRIQHNRWKWVICTFISFSLKYFNPMLTNSLQYLPTISGRSREGASGHMPPEMKVTYINSY